MSAQIPPPYPAIEQPLPAATPHLHRTAYDYLRPSDAQIRNMSMARQAARTYSDALEALLPHGADKMYVLRKLREIAMWANTAITRHADGSPRE